ALLGTGVARDWIGWEGSGRPNGLVGRDPAGADRVPGAGQAAPARQVEPPPVHLAGQYVVVDSGEPGEVRLQVRAVPLDPPAVDVDRLVVGGPALLGVPGLGVVEPLLRQALE